MTLHKLIQSLQTLADKGYDDMEVKMLCCDDSPINNDGIEIKGAYVIDGHSNKNVNGVYIDGTV